MAVVDADVQAILDQSTTVSLTPFIAAAQSLVTRLCSASGYSDDDLDLITTWLAAHFFSIKEQRLASEGAGGASGSYQGQTGMNLSATTYGQQAMLLDTAGNLARLNEHIVKGKRGTVGAVWLGTELETSGE